MKYFTLFAISLALAAVSPAQESPKPRISPLDTVNATIDGNAMKIVYSRPYTKDPKTRRTAQNLGRPCPIREGLANGRE